MTSSVRLWTSCSFSLYIQNHYTWNYAVLYVRHMGLWNTFRSADVCIGMSETAWFGIIYKLYLRNVFFLPYQSNRWHFVNIVYFIIAVWGFERTTFTRVILQYRKLYKCNLNTKHSRASTTLRMIGDVTPLCCYVFRLKNKLSVISCLATFLLGIFP